MLDRWTVMVRRVTKPRGFRLHLASERSDLGRFLPPFLRAVLKSTLSPAPRVPRWRRHTGVALVFAVAGCAYAGPPEPGFGDNLGTHRATWYSYLAGDDISANCAVGSPDRYRLVYNADARRQTRGYDIGPVEADGAAMHQVVDSGTSFGSGRSSPWQVVSPSRSSARLSPGDVSVFEELLAADGVFEPMSNRVRLVSQSYYWVVTACRQGKFSLAAYRHPSDAFAGLQFPGFLEARDTTAIAFPRVSSDWTNLHGTCPPARQSEPHSCTVIEVDSDGLVGAVPRL